MEYSAIYHDMDKRFCYAIDKDLFVIRVQVKKDDMKEIFLHCEDKYIPMECRYAEDYSDEEDCHFTVS